MVALLIKFLLNESNSHYQILKNIFKIIFYYTIKYQKNNLFF